MASDSKDLERMLGSPKKALFHMAIPIFFSILVTTLQSFIDGVWCSGLGPDPLSAITISAPVHGIIASIGGAIGVGKPLDVITEDLVRDVYGINCEVMVVDGSPHVILKETVDD